MKTNYPLRWAVGLVALFVATLSHGQATRTWVSGVGDDANPCSRTAPCKTFAGAISKTAGGGVISVLDPGGYGAVTITKPMTIEGTGTLASALSSATNGVVVNIAAGSTTLPRVVVLRDLLINGAASTLPSLGINGIRFLAGDALILERVSIQQFSGLGVDFQPGGGGTAQFEMRNSSITAAAGGGVWLKPGVGTSARGSIVSSSFSRGQFGLRVEDNTVANVFDSAAQHNTNNGFIAASAVTAAVINLENSVSANNGTNGVVASGPFAVIRIGAANITGNQTGLSVAGGGTVASWRNNNVSGNSISDGVPTVLLTQQ